MSNSNFTNQSSHASSSCDSYAGIINLSRPKSLRPAMSHHDRAAQFSPFAALTGYEESIQQAVLNAIEECNKQDKGIPIEYEFITSELDSSMNEEFPPND